MFKRSLPFANKIAQLRHPLDEKLDAPRIECCSFSKCGWKRGSINNGCWVPVQSDRKNSAREMPLKEGKNRSEYTMSFLFYVSNLDSLYFNFFIFHVRLSDLPNSHQHEPVKKKSLVKTNQPIYVVQAQTICSLDKLLEDDPRRTILESYKNLQSISCGNVVHSG